MHFRLFYSAALTLVGTITLSAVPQDVLAQMYGWTDLGTPGTATAVNGSGQVVGYAPGGNSWWMFSNGTIANLPKTTGSSSAQMVLPNAISDVGQVVGQATIPNPYGLASGPVTTGFSYGLGDSALTLLPSQVLNALGVNDAGQVTGVATFGGNSHAYLLTSGTISDLGALGGPSSVGYGINNAGDVTGRADTSVSQVSHAFLATGGSMIDLGTLGGPTSTGWSVNSLGVVAGWSDTGNGNVHAFQYSNGRLTDLGTLGGPTSQAFGLNDSGQAVGTAQIASGAQHAFVYTSGSMHDLNQMIDPATPLSQFVLLSTGQAINSLGWIVVNGSNSLDGNQHVYVLAPIYFAPASLSFGNQVIGTTSSAQTITLKNNSATSFPIGNLSISGDYSLTNACGSALAPGASCAINVTFTPVATDVRSGVLTVLSGAQTLAADITGVGAISVSLSSSSASTATGRPITLSWIASSGSTCTPSGGTPGDGWVGTLPPTGSASITEMTGGVYTYVLTCAEGSQSASSQAVVNVAWPAVTVSLTASPTAIVAGESTTLTWNSANATSCSATGGGVNDGWPGSKAATSSQTVTEPNALAVPSLTLTFTITCSSATSGLNSQASATVVESNQPAKSGGGGGGAIDLLSLLSICAIAGLRRTRNSDVPDEESAP